MKENTFSQWRPITTTLSNWKTLTPGMKVFLTNTLREDEAGTFMVGDPLVRLDGEPVESREYEFSCPSECTKKLPNPVNVYASLLHMHTTGMEIYNNKLTPNGTFVEHFNKVSTSGDLLGMISIRFVSPRCSVQRGNSDRTNPRLLSQRHTMAPLRNTDQFLER